MMRRFLLPATITLVALAAAALIACGGGKKEEIAVTPRGGDLRWPARPWPPRPCPANPGRRRRWSTRRSTSSPSAKGCDAGKLTLTAATTNEYPLSGETAYGFKITDTATGKLYAISIDPDGKEVDSEALQAGEKQRTTRSTATWRPPSPIQLASASADKPIDVSIRLVEPPYSPPPLPDLSKGLTADQANAYLKLADQKRAEAVSAITKPALDEINKMGLKAEADTYTPTLQASLTPDEIHKAQDLTGIERIYLARVFEPMSDNIARDTVRADVFSYDGSGVKVAETEVGGKINTDNPNLSDTWHLTGSSACLSSHSAAVAGIIRSSNQTVTGIVPAAELLISGDCYGQESALESRTNSAAYWGANVFNNSWGNTSCGFVTGANKFFDDMVANRARSVVFAAGNNGTSSDPCVASPALAYNVIAVGASDDNNTVSWLDDTVADYSSYGNPTTTHNDREEPDVMAPGTNMQSTTNADPWIGDVGSGTSYAAPVVTGVIAQMMQQNPALMVHPAAVRAILMATAIHNIEGDARLSDKDGAGQIDAYYAVGLGFSVQTLVNGTLVPEGQYMATTIGGASPVTTEYTVPLTAGRPTRIVLTWDVDPDYSSYSSEPSGDLDLQVVDPAGQVVAQSTSFDNNYEIAYFTPATAGQYKIRVTRVRWDTGTTRDLAWAFFQGDPLLMPTPVPPTAGPSPTPKPTTAPRPRARRRRAQLPRRRRRGRPVRRRRRSRRHPRSVQHAACPRRTCRRHDLRRTPEGRGLQPRPSLFISFSQPVKMNLMDVKDRVATVTE